MIKSCYNTIELWDEPVKEIRKDANYICEMSEYDHAFLCGLLRKIKPRKILEIGVAEGGTTALILNVLNSFDYEYKFYSVDLSEKYYRDNQKTTGYYTDDMQCNKRNHQFLLGGTIAEKIEIIGENIDFVIIDTTHSMPGEVLDFLTVYPYMAENATIILHDVNLNERLRYPIDKDSCEFIKDEICTKLLFAVVKGIKYMMNDGKLTNIAAFEITNATKDSIIDLFWLLTMSWRYLPNDNMLNSYKNIFSKWYGKDLIDLFDMAVISNKRYVTHIEMLRYDEKYFPYDKIRQGSKIILYGAGYSGRQIKRICDTLNYCSIVGWVDGKYQNIEENIESPEIISEKDADYILIAVENTDTYKEIKEFIMDKNLNIGKQIIGLKTHE